MSDYEQMRVILVSGMGYAFIYCEKILVSFYHYFSTNMLRIMRRSFKSNLTMSAKNILNRNSE